MKRMTIHDAYDELCRQLGLPPGSVKPSKMPAKERKALIEAVDWGRRYKPGVTIMPRPRGAPYQGPTDSFLAFIRVNNGMNAYRKEFGVKRVPAAVTDKLIERALLVYRDAKENTIRRHLRNDLHLLPSTMRSKT